MEKLKNLKWIILIVLLIAVLVLVRMTNSSGFKGDAREVVATISASDFLISANEYNQNKVAFQVVTLAQPENALFENAIQVSFEKLADETTLQQIKASGKKTVLVAANDSQAAKAWVILNQLGIENLFILSLEDNPEILRFNFIPDSTKATVIAE